MWILTAISWEYSYLYLHGQRVGQARIQHEEGSKNRMLVSCLASLTLKIEMICSSDISADFHWTTKHCTYEDIYLYIHNLFSFFKAVTTIYFESDKERYHMQRTCTYACTTYIQLSLKYLVSILTWSVQLLLFWRKSTKRGTIPVWITSSIGGFGSRDNSFRNFCVAVSWSSTLLL